MAITSKSDAQAIVKMNMEDDAGRYIRQIEAILMTWDGKTPIKIHVPANDKELGQHLVAEYRKVGWWPALNKKAGTSKDYWLILFK